MNDHALTQLKILVERAVRPVGASMSRKRTMREELLAHVVGAFEEESVRLGDDREALERTALRFGDPAEITAPLQESVPASDALIRCWEGQPGESTLRGSLRFAGIEAVICLAVCGVALYAAGWWSAWSRAELAAFVASTAFLPFWLYGPLWFVGTAFVAHGMEGALRGPVPLEGWPRIGPGRALGAAWGVPAVRVALTVGGSCFLLLLGLRGANRFATPLEWDQGRSIPAAVLIVGFSAALSVVCAWGLVQTIAERRRDHEEWARLPMDISS